MNKQLIDEMVAFIRTVADLFNAGDLVRQANEIIAKVDEGTEAKGGGHDETH